MIHSESDDTLVLDTGAGESRISCDFDDESRVITDERAREAMPGARLMTTS